MPTLAMWHDRLKDKLNGFRSHEEAMAARRLYDAGVSVPLAQKAIEAVRLESWPPISERILWCKRLREIMGRNLSFAEEIVAVKFQGANYTPEQAAKFYER